MSRQSTRPLHSESVEVATTGTKRALGSTASTSHNQSFASLQYYFFALGFRPSETVQVLNNQIVGSAYFHTCWPCIFRIVAISVSVHFLVRLQECHFRGTVGVRWAADRWGWHSETLHFGGNEDSVEFLEKECVSWQMCSNEFSQTLSHKNANALHC